FGSPPTPHLTASALRKGSTSPRMGTEPAHQPRELSNRLASCAARGCAVLVVARVAVRQSDCCVDDGSKREDPEEHHRNHPVPRPAVVPVHHVFVTSSAYVKMICPPAAFS